MSASITVEHPVKFTICGDYVEVQFKLAQLEGGDRYGSDRAA